MPLYIALVNYTDQGMRDVKNSPARLDAARELLREMGGDFKQVWMTLGEYDLIFVYEAPDDAVSARFLLQLGRLGNVRTRTMKAYPEPAYRQFMAHLD
ncbi:MAG TPA: GYD domain-containing protein [Geminicoccaceae bacterium]|nr:GYD domain-containing protein [Geminicoccaceae bacterium]